MPILLGVAIFPPQDIILDVLSKFTLYSLRMQIAEGNMAILIYWGQNEIYNISQTTFSNVFSSMEMFEFRLKFHESLFLTVQLLILQHWFR